MKEGFLLWDDKPRNYSSYIDDRGCERESRDPEGTVLTREQAMFAGGTTQRPC
jgi:hypothetical protein